MGRRESALGYKMMASRHVFERISYLCHCLPDSRYLLLV